MSKRINKRYSEAFKKHVVSEYEQGQDVYELRKRYGINGNGTIERWVHQYGLKGLRHKTMRIQKPEEVDRIKDLETELARMKAALTQETLDRIMYQSMVDVAKQEYGLDLRKKKPGAKSSSRQRKSETGAG